MLVFGREHSFFRPQPSVVEQRGGLFTGRMRKRSDELTSRRQTMSPSDPVPLHDRRNNSPPRGNLRPSVDPIAVVGHGRSFRQLSGQTMSSFISRAKAE